MGEQLPEEQRENWGSRSGFVLAAIGSAVGLGNLWGFPYKVYANGGGAFLIPYLLAMIFIGIPLLILEFSLGHLTQKAAPEAYRGISRKTEPIGWWGILLGFVIITYYPVILAYCGNYLYECVKSICTGEVLPWAGEGIEGVKNAGEYFSTRFLNEWSAAEVKDGVKPWAFGGFVWPIVGSLAVMWILMYLCIFRGVKMVSKVVLWTVPLPWIMLLVLTIRGLTLPGAGNGLDFFLRPEWSELAKPQTWRWAFGQMFFSMSLAFGVMITYASFLHRKSDINNNATIIGLADVGTSFVAGVAVFATLGAMSLATAQAGNPVAVSEVVKGGPGLAFVAFPYALAQLPGAAWFGAVFFVALLTLGIDSAFSITESVLTSLVDKTGWHRGKTLIGMTLVGFAFGLIYCCRGGLTWLASIDAFINDPWGGIALLGLLECVVVGWAYRLGRLREHANERSDWKIGPWWDWLIRYFAPLILSALFAWSVMEKFSVTGNFMHDADGSLNWPVLVGLVLALAAPAISVVLSLIRSPGANTHAQHVGQPRHGRAMGVFGVLVLLGAGGALVLGCQDAFDANHQTNAAIEALDKEALSQAPAPTSLPQGVLDVSGGAYKWLLIACGLAVVAVVLGAKVVHHAEKAGKRPSGFARSAAGWGVMAVGGGGGLMMSLGVLWSKYEGAIESVLGKAGPAPKATDEGLSGPGYVVLFVMLVLLIGGLGWCFYRAIKAAGSSAGPQLPDDAEGPENV